MPDSDDQRSPPSTNGTGWWPPRTLRALRHPNYALLFSGMVFSLVGHWMQDTALRWLIYRMTSDPFLLGLHSFAAQLPVLALGFVSGVLADRMSRHRLILLTQSLYTVQATVLFALTVLHGADGEPLIRYWHIVALAGFAGILQSFDLPARQAFLAQIVPREDLGNAIALNSLAFNTARIVGPSLAGGVITLAVVLGVGGQAAGEALCFAVNAVTFLIVVVQLLRMRLDQTVSVSYAGSGSGHVAEGLRYAFGQLHIGATIVFVGLIAIFGLPYLVLLPVFARDVFGGDARMLGQLFSSIGIGALTGGIVMARRRRLRGLGRSIAAAALGFSVVIILFSWTESWLLGCLGLVVAGFCMVSAMIGCQTLVQVLVEERFRARVMSLYTMMNLGMMPFGSLLAGWLAGRLGPRVALSACGAVCLLVALGFALLLPAIRRSARATPEYVEAAALSG
ncbi:MAG: MFS transporter [Candidatus Sumerlaeaceae bacterium]|nr:MFS transporter [Candidatus Sumerlaeaceae bacterium]